MAGKSLQQSACHSNFFNNWDSSILQTKEKNIDRTF